MKGHASPPWTGTQNHGHNAQAHTGAQWGVPSFLPHLVAPTLLALAFFPMPRKRILAWAPMVWAPDLDYFLPGQWHRAVTSNIWIPLWLIGLLVIGWRRAHPQERFWDYVRRPGTPSGLLLSTYFISSHLLMDVFAGGVVLLWPLTQTNFFWHFAIIVDTATNEPTAQHEVGTESGIPEVAPLFEWFSPIDTAVLAFLLVSLAGWLGYRAYRRAAAKAAA